MKSIKTALCSLQFVVQSLLMALFCFFLYQYVKSALIEEFDDGLDVYAQSIAARVEVEHEYGKLEIDIEGSTDGEKDSSNYYIVAQADGSPVLRSENIGDTMFSTIDFKNAATETSQQTHLDGLGNCRYKIIKFAPIVDDVPLDQKSWSIFVLRPSSQIDKALESLLIGSILFSSALLLISILLNYFIVKRGLKPLSNIEQEVAKLDTHSLDQRLSTQKLPSELIEIVNKTNALLERMDLGFQREKLFSANTASIIVHENIHHATQYRNSSSE